MSNKSGFGNETIFLLFKKNVVKNPGSFTKNFSQEKQFTTMCLNESRTDDLCSREHNKGKEI